MNKTLIALLLSALTVGATTPVKFDMLSFTGSTDDRKLWVRAVNNPLVDGTNIYFFPAQGIRFETVSGTYTTNLQANDYWVQISGTPQKWTLSVPDSASTQSAAGLTSLSAYTWTNTAPYSITHGANITIATNGTLYTITGTASGVGSTNMSDSGNDVVFDRDVEVGADAGPGRVRSGNGDLILLPEEGASDVIVGIGDLVITNDVSWEGVASGDGSGVTNIAKGPDWTWVFMGDIHSGNAASGAWVDEVDGRAWFSNSITHIVTNKTAANIKAFITAGDVINGSGVPSGATHQDNYDWVTNQLQRLITAGIPVWTCAGNHEPTNTGSWAPSTGDALWDANMGGLLSASGSGFVETNIWGGYRQSLWLQTNSGIKFAIVSTDLFATGRTAWAASKLAEYPEHLGVIVNHTDMGSHQNRLYTKDDGTAGYTDYWALDYEVLSTIPNLVQIHSGHQRDAFNWAHAKEHLESGAVPMHLFFNTQQNTNTGGNYIRYYTFKPNQNKVLARTWENIGKSWLTNGEPAIGTSKISNGYFATFTFPIVERGAKQQFVRLQGLIGGRQQSSATGPGSWGAVGEQDSELFDTAITFDRWNVGDFGFDGFALGRFADSNQLDIIYHTNVHDSFHSGTRLFSFDSSGGLTATSFSGDGSALTGITSLTNVTEDADSVNFAETVEGNGSINISNFVNASLEYIYVSDEPASLPTDRGYIAMKQKADGNMYLGSDGGVEVRVDTDQDGSEMFHVEDGAGTLLFGVESSSGKIYQGTLSSPYILSGSAAPTATGADGSIYLRTTGEAYIRTNATWVKFAP